LPSSHSGSATSRWPPPTSTRTPTWRRKSEPSPESPRPTRRLAATSRPTRYSPSSTASDCSDLPPVDSPATHTNPRSGRNNDDVGSIGDLKLLELVTISRLSRHATTKNANQACWGRAWIRRRLPAVYKKYGLASDPRITRGTLPGVVLATCTDAIYDSRERAQNSEITGDPFHADRG
jgi:hypothetical protein